MKRNPDRVVIFDTTLRDGEQCPGASMGVREKLEVARQLARLGVDIIEAGFPVASAGDFEAVKTVASEVKGPRIAALARWYLGQPEPQPVDETTWKQLRSEHPPRLYLDDAGRKVIVGGREVGLENLPVKAYDMLRYLYQRGGEVITKAELYFLAYRGLDSVPRSPSDEHYEGRKQYEGLVDTNIYRLRKAIEPDPSRPVLLVTKRGHGVVLQVRW